MKKNPGRYDRRRMARRNRKLRGRAKMKRDNWISHFFSIRRKNTKEHMAWVKQLAKLHLYGNKRYERWGKVVGPRPFNGEYYTVTNDILGSTEDVRMDYPN